MMICKFGLMLGLILSVASSWAIGTRGGGKGVVCRDSHNQIQKVELLDIWEARARGVQFPDYQGDIRTHLSKALLRARPFLQDFGFELVDQYTYDHSFSNYAFDLLKCSDSKQTCLTSTVYASYRRVYGRDLPLTNDSFETDLNLPKNCRVEQIVSGVTDKNFDINMDLVKYLDNLNSIGLFLHEAIYGLLSSHYREANSLRIRRVTTHALSGKSFSHRVEYLVSLQVPYISCRNYDNGYWDRLDFVQDPRSTTPKIIALADWIGSVVLIGFENGQLTSTEVNPNVSIQTFARMISEKRDFTITIKGKPDAIEFLTSLNFTMKSGSGTISVKSRTGGSINGTGVEEGITCKLIPSGTVL